jgi:hypothetical protein
VLTQTDPELIERIDNFAFDEVIAESDLDIRTRLMVQLASMIGCQAVGEFRVMAGAGLTVGLAVQKQIVGGERVDASRSPVTRTPSMPYEPSTRSPLPTATKGQAHDRSLSIHHQDCRRGRGGDCRRLAERSIPSRARRQVSQRQNRVLHRSRLRIRTGAISPSQAAPKPEPTASGRQDAS